MNEPATTEELASVAAMAKKWLHIVVATVGLGGLGGMATAGYGTYAAAQEVPLMKKRLNEIEMNVYFLCLMQEQAEPAARAMIEKMLQIPVKCRPPVIE